MRFLVVDDRQFQRRLAADALRSTGRGVISYANSSAECLSACANAPPDILIVDWAFENGAGLRLVEQLRAGKAGDAARNISIILLADRRRQRDVDTAREAGIDEFVLRPFSPRTIHERVRSIEQKRAYAEGRAPGDDSPETQIRKGLVRMYVERLSDMLLALGPEDGARDFKLACSQLNVLANDLKEPLLIAATFSLANYVKGASGSASFNRSVVEAHLQAILQLAELPNSQYDIRRTVTDELKRLVGKKLGHAR